jgi:hypothetical protein
LGDVRVPFFPQQYRIGGERCEWGLETVREIGGAVSRQRDSFSRSSSRPLISSTSG